ncbi:hypothetical protein TNCV_5118321 [Trichonephila clavipes]|nr:hypothetical protein TNCV_5118321 [Trichonephila clavipes]
MKQWQSRKIRRPLERINWKKRSPSPSLMDDHPIKKRPPRNHKWNKRRVPLSLIPSGLTTRKRTRREDANERHVLSRELLSAKKSNRNQRKTIAVQNVLATFVTRSRSSREKISRSRRIQPGKSSPYELRNRRQFNGRQEQPRKISPCSSRRAVATEERPVRSRRIQPGRPSPYELRNQRQFNGRQEQSRKTNPCSSRRAVATEERPVGSR